MAKIGRSFDQLNDKIKQVQSNIKTTETSIKSLDKALQLDPSNVDAVRQKYTLLSQNVKNTTERLELLRKKQQLLNTDFENGAIKSSTYNKQLATITEQIKKAEESLDAMNTQLGRQNQEIMKANFSKVTQGLEKVESGVKKASMACIALVTALSAVMIKSIENGDELADLSQKYDTTAENIQLWRNRLAMCAQDTEAYVSSLQTVGSMMTSISAGRGARYLTYLEQLGIAQEDLEHKTNAEVFDIIYNALRGVTDEVERTTIAQGLLGDKGLEIADIAGVETEKLRELDEELINSGLITQEQAGACDEAANTMTRLQQQFQLATMELTVSLMPAFEAVVNILQNSVIPVITNLANWFGSLSDGEQGLLLGLLSFVIILPKVISLTKGMLAITQAMTIAKNAQTIATNAQTGAQLALNAATAPWLPIIIAVSAALSVLIGLISVFSSKAKEATTSADDLAAKLEGLTGKYNDMGYDIEAETKSTYDVNNNRTATIDVNVTSTGDTPISNDNAEKVATTLHDQIMTDLINQGLGSIIK